MISMVFFIIYGAIDIRTSQCALFASDYKLPLPSKEPEKKKAVLPAYAEETAHFPTTHSKAIKPWRHVRSHPSSVLRTNNQ
tara:strand:+ start:498 stop:740 length:243 start_codon:yes stop_codon:yes gene_type:complete